MGKIRIISDIHGDYLSYIGLINDPSISASIQLGDLGLQYLEFLEQIDPNLNKIIMGNHDKWDDVDKYPQMLKYCGECHLGSFSFFYIAGAYSIDKAYRIPGVSWFKEEEMTHIQGIECIKLFEIVRPDIVCSHDCPNVAFNIMTQNSGSNGSITRDIMDACLERHKPLYWYFGHHHPRKITRFKIDKTEFIGIPEKQFVDLVV
jgi:hypothetical protein